MRKPLFKEFDFLVHQIIYPFEFGFNERCSGFHFCKVPLHTFKITVQLLCEKGHYRKQHRNDYPEYLEFIHTLSHIYNSQAVIIPVLQWILQPIGELEELNLQKIDSDTISCR